MANFSTENGQLFALEGEKVFNYDLTVLRWAEIDVSNGQKENMERIECSSG